MRLTLDSNILVYAAHPDDQRHARAVAVVARARRADCIQTLQSLGESFRVLTARRGWEAEKAIAVMTGYRHLFEIVAANADDFVVATAAVRDHRLSFWDAMLWATARRAGCRLILTEDGHDGRNLGGVRSVNPFLPENEAIVDLALPPEEPLP
jgi:predicted nucleic acid-binding protein